MKGRCVFVRYTAARRWQTGHRAVPSCSRAGFSFGVLLSFPRFAASDGLALSSVIGFSGLRDLESLGGSTLSRLPRAGFEDWAVTYEAASKYGCQKRKQEVLAEVPYLRSE